MKLLRWLAIGLAGLVALLVLAFAVAAWVYRDIPAATLEAKYGNAASQYTLIDGVRIHYRDEGSRDAPVVVLIHAHFASLLMWDPWVAALTDKYRVVRFDLTTHGLTGTDPSGDYSLPRTIELAEKLIDSLQLQHFTLGGTSLGGTVAIHYAARHPERVDRLILISPGALNERVRGSDKPPQIPAWVTLFTYVTPRALPEFVLKKGYGDPAKVSDELVTQWHELLLREGNRPAELERNRQYVSGKIEGQIRAVRAPVLIMWGEKNPQVPVEQAQEFKKLLENSPDVRLIVYPGVGHMAVQEAPEQTARDIRTYLDTAVPTFLSTPP